MKRLSAAQELIFLLERLPDDRPEIQEVINECMQKLDAMAPSMTDGEFMEMLRNAPEDDEEETEEERLAIEEARAEIKAGKATPIDSMLLESCGRKGDN